MAFDWKEFLVLAKTLMGQTESGHSAEAVSRTAVSRAYYAAFCWARNYAQSQLGFQRTGRAEDHGRLRSHLAERGMTRVASRLNKLRQWRNQCDYDDRVANIGNVAGTAIQCADDVIHECG